MSAPIVIICLGNSAPRLLTKHPQPPAVIDGIPALEDWAQNICGLDISGVPAVGDWVEDINGKPTYQVDESHRAEFLRELIAAPFDVPHNGPKSRTVFELPTVAVLDEAGQQKADAAGQPLWRPQDSLSEVLTNIRKVWSTHSNAAPGWIAGTHDFMVQAVAMELGITDIREWLPAGERGDINYKPFGV